VSEINGFPWDQDLVWLEGELATEIKRLWALGFTEAARGLLDAAFEVPFTRAAIYAQTRAGWLVKETDGITRERIQELFARTLGPMYANPEVSDLTLADAIRAEFTDMAAWRADLIARTETAYAAAYGAIEAYKEGGVTEVEISDGDDWDEPCIAADGAIWSLADYQANPLEHPNCTRAAYPIVTTESLSEVPV
jgi:hypothetical protein